jgi:hypothetical protein
VQRLLVARSQKDASAGLVLSGFLVFAQFALFLFLGTLLWAHYGGKPFARGDEVLPTFVSTELAGGWTGFILAAVVAAALSPSLNSMASTTVRDFYLPYFRKDATEAQQMRVGRAFTVVWGIAQILVAVAAQNMDSALQGGLAALSYASGPTVGAFLLGVLTRRANVGGHDDRDDRGAGTQPGRRDAGALRPAHRGRGLDLERGRGRDRDVRGGHDPQHVGRSASRPCSWLLLSRGHCDHASRARPPEPPRSRRCARRLALRSASTAATSGAPSGRPRSRAGPRPRSRPRDRPRSMAARSFFVPTSRSMAAPLAQPLEPGLPFSATRRPTPSLYGVTAAASLTVMRMPAQAARVLGLRAAGERRGVNVAVSKVEARRGSDGMTAPA